MRPQLSTPLDFLFYLSIVNNVFCLLGMAGVFNHQRLLVIAYFVYNAAQVVVTFHYFVDACADVGIHYEGGQGKTVGYERAAAGTKSQTSVPSMLDWAVDMCSVLCAVHSCDHACLTNRLPQRQSISRLLFMSRSSELALASYQPPVQRSSSSILR